jgi:hypothetical protein
MSTTTFVDGQTRIESTWLNDVDSVVYETVPVDLMGNRADPLTWTFSSTNIDGAGYYRWTQDVPDTVSLIGNAAVQGMGMFYYGNTSAQTPNAGLAETNILRMDYTVNSDAGSKVQIALLNGLLKVANDEDNTGNENTGLLFTTRSTGPIGGTRAVGNWAADFHVEKEANVSDGSMVALEVGVHKAPALSTAKCRGIDVWSGDRSGITASRAGDAIHMHGNAGWTNYIQCMYTNDTSPVFTLDKDGNILITNYTGASSFVMQNGVNNTASTIQITGKDSGGNPVAAFIQADPNGQINMGATGNHDIVFQTNSTNAFRVKALGSVRFLPLASAPASAEAGDVYYNSTTNKHYGYNGTTWNAMY